MFLFFWHPIRDTVQGENRSRPVALSGKPLGERQLAIPAEIKIYTPDARGTNDHVGQGLHDHSYLPCQSPGSCSTQSCTAQYTFVRPLYMWDVPLGFHLPSHTYVTQNLWGTPYL